MPDRIHQLSHYIEQLRLEFNEISDYFNILNYFQDLPESSPERLVGYISFYIVIIMYCHDRW